MAEKNTPFVVGVEVAIFTDEGWSSTEHVTVTKVAKVYANGNFIVEGDEQRQQWRQWGEGRAIRTGNHHYRCEMRILTDKVRERAIKTERKKRWRSAVANLGRLPTKDFDIPEEDVAALELIVGRVYMRSKAA